MGSFTYIKIVVFRITGSLCSDKTNIHVVCIFADIQDPSRAGDDG